MSYGKVEQIEGPLHLHWLMSQRAPTAKELRKLRRGPSEYRRCMKAWKHRAERRRAKADPECAPGYRRFAGWEW